MRLTPRGRALLTAGAWLAATALAVVALRALGWRAALDAVRAARPGWVALAVACHASIVALWAWQTSVLWPRGPDAPPPRHATAFEVQALTAMATNTVPAFLGQATGVALLAERGGIGTAAALGVFAQHNLVEGVAKVAVLLAAAQVAPLPPALRRAAWALTGLVVAMAALLALAASAGRAQPGQRVPGAGPGLTGRARALVRRWAHALDALRAPWRLFGALLLALAMKAAEAAGWWAVERALGVRPRPGSPVLALAATNLASAVPATPGNLGVYEGAAYAAYHTLLGVPRETAVALALVGHACYLVPLVGMGWAMLSAQQLGRWRRRRPPR